MIKPRRRPFSRPEADIWEFRVYGPRGIIATGSLGGNNLIKAKPIVGARGLYCGMRRGIY